MTRRVSSTTARPTSSRVRLALIRCAACCRTPSWPVRRTSAARARPTSAAVHRIVPPIVRSRTRTTSSSVSGPPWSSSRDSQEEEQQAAAEDERVESSRHGARARAVVAMWDREEALHGSNAASETRRRAPTEGTGRARRTARRTGRRCQLAEPGRAGRARRIRLGAAPLRAAPPAGQRALELRSARASMRQGKKSGVVCDLGAGGFT